MTPALICDDEPLMRANLREHLQRLWPGLRIVAEADNGADALRLSGEHRPDGASLDIQMPGLTGLQVATLIDPATQVVFVTAYEQHALEAFEAHAVDYLLKPLDPARLAKLVTRLQRQPAQHGQPGLEQMHQQMQAMLRQLAVRADPPATPPLDWLQVDQGRQVRMLHVDDVKYFESDSKYTRVVADDCDGLIRLSLKELLNSLDPQAFVQVHRSVVVNRRFVHSVHRRGEQMELQIQGRDERVRVSESNQSLFRAM